MNHHAKSTTPGTGGTEERNIERSPEFNGEGRAESAGTTEGSVSVRTPRATRPPAITSDPITGGILSQLINQTKSQLAKARDCIAWYEQEVKEFQDQLNQLEHLQQQLEEQQSDE